MDSVQSILLFLEKQTTEFFTEGKNDILAGFLVPVIIWLVVMIYHKVVTFIRYKPYRSVLGTYHFYHYAPSGRDEICYMTVEVKKSWGNIWVKANSYEYKYKGSIEFKRNLYIRLQCINFSEQMLFVFPEFPPIEKIRRLWGVGVGVSPFYEPVSYKVVLSDTPLESEIHEIFEKNIDEGHLHLLRVGIKSDIRDDNI